MLKSQRTRFGHHRAKKMWIWVGLVLLDIFGHTLSNTYMYSEAISYIID